MPSIKPEVKILNICSPFGLNSKELFLNIQYKGIISNKLSKDLYLTDLDGSLVNIEGSPIIRKSDRALIGIRLPNFHSKHLFMNAALFTPIGTVLQKIFKMKFESKVS